MGNCICNVSKSLIDGVYDCLCIKSNKNDDKIFPINEIKEPFKFKYDGSEIFWCEWWTLYFYGNDNDKICGMINYIFIKGLNQIGECIIYPAFCNNNNKVNTWDKFELNNFEHSDNMIKISQNEISEISNNKYLINGNSSDNTIKWSLIIDRKKYNSLNVAQKIKLPINSKIELPSLESLSFASIIPLGTVSGNIMLNGVKYKIDQLGELEHLWGPVVLPTINWNLLFGSDINDNLIYWLHSPFSSKKDKGCIYLNLNNKKYYIRDYEVIEDRTVLEYPEKILIKCPFNSIEIEYEIISTSASNNGSASENHVKINVSVGNQNFVLFGMAEYYRSKVKFLSEKKNKI